MFRIVCNVISGETTQVDLTPEEIANLPDGGPALADYQFAVQALVDETARSKQFNDGVTLASYIASTVAAWSTQAEAFIAWRDSVWQYSYLELAKVQAGERDQPTVEAFLTELPEIIWP